MHSTLIRTARLAMPATLALMAVLAAAPPAAAGETVALDRVIAEALEHNPEIRAARREQEAAAQRIAPAGALDDPMMELGVLNLPTRSFSFSREDMTMKMMGLSQRLPYPGKRALRREVAEQDATTIGHAVQETVNRVAREVRLAYYDLALVHESNRLVEQNRAILIQLLKVADTRYSVGQSNQVDVLRAQTQLSRMNEELIRLARERPMFEAELARLVGRPGSRETAAPAPLELREIALSYDALTDKAWRGRPQLLGVQSVIARNERSIDLARRDRFPDFDVRVAYGQRDSMPDGTRRSDMLSFTVAMNLPVWRQTKTLPKIAEAVAMHEQASSLYEAQRNETAMKLRQQIAIAEQSLRAAKLYASEILPQSRLTVEAAMAAYQVGRSDFALLLDNQMAVLNAQIAYVTAVAGYNKALAEIEFLTGVDPASGAATKQVKP